MMTDKQQIQWVGVREFAKATLADPKNSPYVVYGEVEKAACSLCEERKEHEKHEENGYYAVVVVENWWKHGVSTVRRSALRPTRLAAIRWANKVMREEFLAHQQPKTG